MPKPKKRAPKQTPLEQAQEIFTAACIKQAKKDYNCACDGCIGKASGSVAGEFLLDVMSMNDRELTALEKKAP